MRIGLCQTQFVSTPLDILQISGLLQHNTVNRIALKVFLVQATREESDELYRELLPNGVHLISSYLEFVARKPFTANRLTGFCCTRPANCSIAHCVRQRFLVTGSEKIFLETRSFTVLE